MEPFLPPGMFESVEEPLDLSEATFPVRLTARDDSEGEWRYAWVEQTFNPSTGLYSDADPARRGSVALEYAVERNGLEVGIGAGVYTAHLKGWVNGQLVYEFDGSNVNGPGTTVVYVDVSNIYNYSYFEFNFCEMYFYETYISWEQVFVDWTNVTINVHNDNSSIFIENGYYFYIDGPGYFQIGAPLEICGWLFWCFANYIPPGSQVDDWALPATVLTGEKVVFRWLLSGHTYLNGAQFANAGQVICVVNTDTTYSLYVTHENTSSTAAYRFNLENAQDVEIKPRGMRLFWYDYTSARWRGLGGAGGSGSASFNGARQYRTSNQGVSSGSYASIEWTHGRYDEGGYWSAGNPTRLTAPETGWYEMGGHARFTAGGSTAELLSIRIRVNGITTIAQVDNEQTTAGGMANPTDLSVSTGYKLTAGDYVELQVFQNTGASLDITASENSSPEMWMHKVAGALTAGAGSGTVTSINVAGPGYGLSTSGGPITGSGTITISLIDDLLGLENLSTTGLAARTSTSTWATRIITGPAAGIGISNGDGVSGNPTLALQDDLLGLEDLSGTGFAARTTTSTWANRTLTAPAAGLTISNPAGIAGNPTFALANDLAALEALSGTNTIYYRSAADTWTAVTIGVNVFFASGTLSADSTVTTITANTTLDSTYSTVLCNNSSDIMVTLPAAASHSGRKYRIKKIGNNANTVTIDGNASETIDGATTLLLYVRYDWVEIQSDGSNWHVISDGLIPHEARMRNAAGQSIADVTDTQIDFDTEDFDVGGIASTAGDSFTIRRAGKYAVAIAGQHGGSPTTHIWSIYINGVSTSRVVNSDATAGYSACLALTDTFDLAAGDTVTLYGYQDSTGAQTTSTALSQQPRMSVVEIR